MLCSLSHAIGLDRDAATLGAPLRVRLNQLHRETFSVQRATQRQSANPAPDNQDRLDRVCRLAFTGYATEIRRVHGLERREQ